MYFIVFVVGFLFGVFVAVLVARARSIGTLHVEQLDWKQNPLLFLELFKDTDDISFKRYVTLSVHFSHK